jgi:hypothetical protein
MGVAEGDQQVLPWREEVLPRHRIASSVGSGWRLNEQRGCKRGHGIASSLTRGFTELC